MPEQKQPSNFNEESEKWRQQIMTIYLDDIWLQIWLNDK